MNLMNSNVPFWYCVHTRSRHEDVVYQRLSGKNIHVFLPKMEVWSTRRDRRKKIQKALFSGYLFVHENLSPRTHLEILKTPGLVQILGNENGPQPVPDIQIESIQKIMSGKNAVSPFPYLKEGQRIRIVDGPLKDCEGYLLKKQAEKEKLIISVDLLKRSLSIEIEGASIEPVT